MTLPEIADALGPLFAFLAPSQPVTGAAWEQYALALEQVNPGDLDDAITDLRKTHAFRNAPLPADILRRCDEARRRRAADAKPAPTVTADPSEGEWQTFTLKGIGSLRMHVLPDDHPALPRYACLRCKDTSWEEIPPHPDAPPSQPTCRRCRCWATNPVIQQQRTKDAEHRRTRAQR